MYNTKRRILFLFFFFYLIPFAYSDTNNLSNLTIETRSGGEYEWVDNPVYSGEHSLRLYFTEKYGYCMLKVPYNKTLSKLGSIEFIIKYSNARPRFALILDKNDDKIPDSILLSDYSKDGEGKWTRKWGGSRWGWDETSYPLTHYGGPWKTLTDYQSDYPEANVLAIVIVAEYWAFEPEGIGESLYIDGLEINGVYHDFEEQEFIGQDESNESITFALDPEYTKLPLLMDEEGEILGKISLNMEYIDDLKSFSWEEDYDSEYLDLWSVRLGSETYHETGGWHRSGRSGTFPRDSFTGSGTLLEFYFKPKKIGQSIFKVFEIKLYNSQDQVILTGRAECEIDIITFTDWINGEYGKLEEKYRLLESEYNKIKENISLIQNDYDDLESLNEQLRHENSELENDLEGLEYTVQNLTGQVNRLESEIEELEKNRIPGFPLVAIIVSILLIVIVKKLL